MHAFFNISLANFARVVERCAVYQDPCWGATPQQAEDLALAEVLGPEDAKMIREYGLRPVVVIAKPLEPYTP